MGDKRSHSPGGGGRRKRSRGGPGRGFFGGPMGPPRSPGWGPPPPRPPPPRFPPGLPPPPPFPGRGFGFLPPPPGDDFDLDMIGGHRDDWYPGAPPPPPPPPGETPKPKPVKKEDFSDDNFAIYGSGARSGRGGGFRGFGDRGRGKPLGSPTKNGRGRGTGNQGRGGPATRGNRGGQNQTQTATTKTTTTTNAARGRGRGQVQKGMPPNVFDWRAAKARKDAWKAAKKAKQAAAGITPAPTVPPVHSLAKVTLDVSTMSAAEKIHRFSLYVRNDPMKENAIQHIMNAQTGSKLMVKVEYEAEALAKVGSKHMYTGCLKIAGVFLARAVSVNKKELKHLVFQKVLNVLMTKTVAEIYNLVDPGVDTLRDELEREEQLENQKKDTRSRDWMGQDIGEAFQIIIDKLKNTPVTVDSDISRIEQAITAVQCVIRHQFLMDTVKHKNGRSSFKGALEINNIVIGRATSPSKKGCKRLTYSNAMERLTTKSIEELMIPVPEEEINEEEMEDKEPKPSPKKTVNLKVSSMNKKEKFSELIKTLKTLPFKDSNINPIDVTSLQFGITPMAVYRKLEKKRDEDDTLSCELYLDNTFIASADGRQRNFAQKEAYNKAWELLTTTDVDTLLTQHAVISPEELQTRDVSDIIIKGGGRTIETNLAGLRRINKDDLAEKGKKQDIVVVEHADWSNDRMRNSFAILQCSCTQNAMLLKWITEGNSSKYLCEVFIEDEKVGEAYSNTKQNARALAMTDALFKLYATQDVVRISRRDDSKGWIPWQKIVDQANELKKKDPQADEEPEGPKTDEKGFFLPDKYLIEVMSKRLEKFANESGFEEVIFGPGMPATENREIRAKGRELKLMVDIRQHLGESYLIFYKRLNYPDLVKLLKKRKRPYGKYELVPHEELPKHADIEPMIKAAEVGRKLTKEEDMSDDD